MHVLISGASIAGPALAFWLRRYGIDVTLVERAPELRTGGYCVDIRGVALEVIERMGLRETLRPFEADTLTNSVVDREGRRFGRTSRGFGVIDEDDIEIPRGDLSRVLYDVTREHVHYRFGDSIVALEQHSDGVEVAFASGSVETFDLLVGADGVHSHTRALGFGPEHDFLREMGSCMAIFTAPNHLGLDREQLLFSGVRQIASIKSAANNRELKVCVFFAIAPGTFDHRDERAQRQHVASAFAQTGWEFPTFIEAMWRADDFYCDLTCQVRMDKHHADRVALIGDAAYCPSPMSGQGTSLALVGAYVLAAELAKARDYRVAFENYDDKMRAFVTRNQAVALKIGDAFAPQTPWQVRMRNWGMRVLPYMPASRLIMKLAMRDVREAAHALVLPTPDA